MSQLNGRKVTIARLHVPIHFNGVGSIASPITSNSAKLLGELSMTRVDGGILLEVKNQALFVPDGNIQSLQLAPVVPESK